MSQEENGKHACKIGFSTIITFGCIYSCGSSILNYIYYNDAILNVQFLKNYEDKGSLNSLAFQYMCIIIVTSLVILGIHLYLSKKVSYHILSFVPSYYSWISMFCIIYIKAIMLKCENRVLINCTKVENYKSLDNSAIQKSFDDLVTSLLINISTLIISTVINTKYQSINLDITFEKKIKNFCKLFMIYLIGGLMMVILPIIFAIIIMIGNSCDCKDCNGISQSNLHLSQNVRNNRNKNVVVGDDINV